MCTFEIVCIRKVWPCFCYATDEIAGARVAADTNQLTPVMWIFVNRIKTWHAWTRLWLLHKLKNIETQKYEIIIIMKKIWKNITTLVATSFESMKTRKYEKTIKNSATGWNEMWPVWTKHEKHEGYQNVLIISPYNAKIWNHWKSWKTSKMWLFKCMGMGEIPAAAPAAHP